jgi:hypothetical protein
MVLPEARFVQCLGAARQCASPTFFEHFKGRACIEAVGSTTSKRQHAKVSFHGAFPLSFVRLLVTLIVGLTIPVLP